MSYILMIGGLMLVAVLVVMIVQRRSAAPRAHAPHQQRATHTHDTSDDWHQRNMNNQIATGAVAGSAYHQSSTDTDGDLQRHSASGWGDMGSSSGSFDSSSSSSSSSFDGGSSSVD